MNTILGNEYSSTWSEFTNEGGQYTHMSDFVSDYQNALKDSGINLARTWAGSEKTDLRCLYNSDGALLYSKKNYNGFNAPLPSAPSKADGKESVKNADGTKILKCNSNVSFEIVLPAEYLLINDPYSVNSQNYYEIIQSTISSAVSKAVTQGKIKVDAAKFKDLDTKNMSEDKVRATVINRITTDMFDSVFYEINSQIADSKYGNKKTSYTFEAISRFESFCDAVSGPNLTSSVIYDVLKNLSLTYAFEGDVKREAAKYYATIGTGILQFGSIVTLLASVGDTTETQRSNLISLIKNTLERNRTTYEGFLTGHDNYCYPLKGLLSYVDVSAQSVVKSYSNNSVARLNSFSDWALVDSSINFVTDDIDYYESEAKNNEAVLKNAMPSTGDLQYLYYYFSASAAGEDIIKYLQGNGVMSNNGKHSSILITSDTEIEKQPLDKTILRLTCFGFDPERSGFGSNYEELPGYIDGKYVSPITKDSFITVVSDKLVGKTFSLEGSVEGEVSKADPASRLSENVTLATRVVQYSNGPVYLMHDDANVTVSVSEEAQEYAGNFDRRVYTAKADKAEYGALVLNYNKKDDPYKYNEPIENEEQFIGFLKKIASGSTYENQSVILKNDIDLTGVKLEECWPDSAFKAKFKGHFNGNGHTVKNIAFSSSEHRVGLFRSTDEGAVIENLNLENVNISASADKKGYAALIGYANGDLTVKNVNIKSGTVSGYKYVGGLVGEANDDCKMIFSNCTNSADITSSGADAGGMAGNIGEFFIIGCENNGNVTAKIGSAGGMVGYTDKDAQAKRCRNCGAITAEDCAGGICGFIESDSRFSTFKANINTGSILSETKGSAGGIVGNTHAGGAYIQNKNSGSVESKCDSENAGGILGRNQDDPILFKRNSNDGNITGIAHTGGIAGSLGDHDHDKVVSLISNTNSGTITATSTSMGDAGGIIGAIRTDNQNHKISHNSNYGSVNAERQAGGIVGWMEGGGTFDSNRNGGNIVSVSQNAGGIVGNIEDDECEFKDTYLYDGYAGINIDLKSDKAGKYEYVITTKNKDKHAGKICGWDGNKDAVINNDTLLASIFGEGNIIVITAMFALLIAAAVIILVVYKKRKTGIASAQA